ncbi:MAG: heat-inducible transcription repressor HrcA, partial [Desulfovibrionales bacterium]
LQEGLVQNKVIQVDETITSDELSKYRNYLNEQFEGKTIGQIRGHILREMEQVRDQFNSIYRKALGLARKTFMDESREIFVEGTSHILNHPEFSDLTSMRELFKILEERSKLLEILDKVAGEEGIKIMLGQETQLENVSYGLISSPYGTAGEVIGALGIIGPLRMNYSKVVPVVDFTAQMLSQVLKKRM